MFTTNLSMSGGIQKLVLRTSESLVARGHSVDIYTFEHNAEACYPQINHGAAIHVPRSPGSLSEASRELAAAVPEVDLVIVHDVGTMPILEQVDFRPRKPRVLWMLNHEFSRTSFSVWRRLAIALRTVWRQRDVSQLPDVLDEWRRARATRAAISRIDCAATYDRANAHAVRRLGLPARVVYAAADLEDFRQLGGLRSDREEAHPFTVLSVGVLLPYRRFEDLLRAVAILNEGQRQHRLVIVGSERLAPGYAKFLRTLIEDLDLTDHVDMLGVVDDARMKALYADSDAFAFVNDGNTWGISVFEGLAAGLPVVLTDNIGASDLLVDGRDAHLVPPRDPRAIAAALESLAASSDRGRELARTGYASIADTLTWSAFTDRLLALDDEQPTARGT